MVGWIRLQYNGQKKRDKKTNSGLQNTMHRKLKLLFVFLEKALHSLPRTNKGTCRREEEHSWSHRHVGCLLKNTSTKHVVNQKREHLEEISFWELFDRIEKFLYNITVVEIYSVSAEKIISDAFSYSENV